MLNSNFVILGTLIGAIGAIVYIVDTLSGRVKPNRVSFLLWSIAPLIAFAAQVKEGVGIESLMTFSAGFLPLLTFGASFLNKKSEWNLTRFDLVCGALSIIGLILWIITKEGTLAILFSILSDGLAAMPTIVKSYKYPDTEHAWPWLTTVIGVFLTLLTLDSITFINSGFILYIFIINIIIFSTIQFRLGERVEKWKKSLSLN